MPEYSSTAAPLARRTGAQWCPHPAHHPLQTPACSRDWHSPRRPQVLKHQTTHHLPLRKQPHHLPSAISQRSNLACLSKANIAVLQQASVLFYRWAASSLEADPTSPGQPRHTVMPENGATNLRDLSVPWLLLIIPPNRSTYIGSSSNFFFFLISKNNTELKHIKPPLPQRHHLWNQGKHFQELLGRPSVCSQHRNPAQLYLLPLQIKHSCYLIYPDIFGSIFQAFETTSVFNQAFKMSSGGLVLS